MVVFYSSPFEGGHTTCWGGFILKIFEITPTYIAPFEHVISGISHSRSEPVITSDIGMIFTLLFFQSGDVFLIRQCKKRNTTWWWDSVCILEL